MTALWRGRWLISAAFAAGSGVALGAALAATPVYLATASLTGPDAEALARARDAVSRATTLERAAEAVAPAGAGRRPSILELREVVSASAIEGADTLEVEVRLPDPAVAQQLATAVARATAAQAGGEVRVLEAAARPRDPVSPRPVRDGLVAGAATAAAAAVALLAVERGRRRITAEQDVARLFGPVPVAGIAEAPEADPGEPLVLSAPDSAAAADFADLAAALIDAGPPRRVVVTSAGRGEGKSTVAGSLAVALAAEGLRVVVLDADLRRPRIAELFDVPADPGLADVLAGGVALGRAARPSEIPGLWAIPAGTGRSGGAELLTGVEMEAVLQEVEDRADVAVVDGPPLAEEPEGVATAARADVLLLSVRAGRSLRSSLARAGETLAEAGVQAAAVVVVGMPSGEGPLRSSRPAPGAERERPQTPEGTEDPTASGGWEDLGDDPSSGDAPWGDSR